MPASSEASSLGVHRCLRIVAESLSALLLLSSIALTVCTSCPRACVLCACAFHASEIDSEQRFSVLNSRCPTPACQSFGAFMLYWWKRGDETQAHPVPGYIYLVLALGCAASTSNALSYIGACSRSVFLLSISFWTVLLVLLLEAALAGVLFFSPALLDTVVCPPLDAACLERIDNLFKDPSAHAGVVVAVVCGAQALTLLVLLLLRRSTRLQYNREQDIDGVFWERGGLRRSLLEERDWQSARDSLEERARQRVERHSKQYRSLISNVARDALASKPPAVPAATWDSNDNP